MCRFIEQFRAEGLEQGLERGLAQGRMDEQKRIAENMILKGCEDEFILSVTGITRECLDTIKNAI